MKPSRLFWFFALFLLLGALSLDGRAAPSESVRRLPPLDEDAMALLVRAVDHWTGEGLAAARADLFEEVAHPRPGFGDPVASGRADAWGWIRVPAGDLEPGAGDWVYVSAEGYGPDARFESFLDEVVGLVPAVDLELEFRDPLERPVEDMSVSLLLGCGHAPDVRLTRTDARGVAVLRDVQTTGYGQVWIAAPGILSEYGPFEPQPPGTPPLLHRCGWSSDVFGRVLRHDETPAAGVAVGLSNYHRGPWTTTDAHGRFHLTGAGLIPGSGNASADPESWLIGDDEGGRRALWFVVPPPDVERVITLPAPGEDFEEEERTSTIEVALDVEGEVVPGALAVTPELMAVRDGDGWTDGAVLDEESGTTTVACPPGRYTLIAWLGGDAPYPGLSQRRASVEVVAGETARLAMTLPAPRVVRLEVGHLPDDVGLSLVTEGWSMDLGFEHEDDDGVLLAPAPREGPVHLRVVDEEAWDVAPREAVRVVAIPAASLETDGPAFGVPFTARTTLRAHFTDEAGRPVEASLAAAPWREGGEAGTHATLVVPAVGLDAVAVVPVDDDAFETLALPLPLPLPAGGAVDLGRVVLAPREDLPPRLVVLGLDGRPEDVTLRIVRGERRVETRAPAMEEAGEAIGPGARVFALNASAEDAFVLPWRTTLEGPGPWTIRPPSGRLLLRVVDAEGRVRTDEARIEVDGVLVRPPARKGPEHETAAAPAADPGVVQVAGLASGPHDVLVWLPGHAGQHHRIVLAEGEHRPIEVRPSP